MPNEIQERGVDFEPTEEYVQALKDAGAQEAVIQAVVRSSALAQESGTPLTSVQVLRLVRLGMNGAELAKRIRARGLDFEPTDGDLAALRRVGAQEVVIKAIREVKPKPLTSEQIGKLVAGGVPSERATALVKQRGIDFVADEQYLDMLRTAGADDTLLAAVRQVSAAVTAEVVVATSPGATVYLDGALQGHASEQGELAVQSKPGAHELRVSLKTKRDFTQSLTLAPRQTTKIEAALVDLPGSIRVQTAAGAEVVIDNSSRGRANAAREFVVQDVAAGSRQLRVSAPGKTEFRQSITVLAG